MTADSDKPEVDPRQVEAFEPLPGDLLVCARRSRGMSTGKAASALNLDESVVLALEENRFGDLGAPVFARGHLRKYARLLGLNADDVIRAYDAVATEQSAAALNVSASVAQPVSESSGHWILKILILVAVATLAVVVWRILSSGDGPAATPAVTEPARSTRTVPSEQLLPPPVETGPGTEEPAGTGTVTEARELGTPGREEPPGPAGPRPRVAQASPEPADVAEPVQSAAPVVAEAAGPLVFVFEQDSWLEVRDGDGRRLAYELGRRGTRRTITGRGPFRVSLGYWPGVSVSYGGEDVAIPESARQGNMARFSVPAGAGN